jgi:phosphate transport system permease protein
VRYGALALFVGTLSVTALAMVAAVPVGLLGAIYLAELAPPRVREPGKIIIELLAAIPSVVWGFIALTVVSPLMVSVLDLPVGLNVANGALVLALMSLPVIISLGEDALRAVPDSYREAAEALGATRWETTTRVVVPAARNGLLAAVLLGVSRVVGETMAVLMATGHSVRIPHSIFDPVRTLTATIAAELGEAPKGGEHYRALFTIGLCLFVITFVINWLADRLIRRAAHRV